MRDLAEETMTAPPAADWEALASAISGEVIRPGSPRYEEARQPATPGFHEIRPEAVVRCATPGDVARAVAFARQVRLHVVARSGGHCFAGRSSTEGIVIDVGPMHSVTIGDGRTSVGAGARLGDLYDALDRHGLTIAAGCGPDVAIAGLTLGGGLGILGRIHGLTCDNLLAARVVLADGRVVDCDDHRHPDLFWALRGAGGGQFGVVTTLEFRTLSAPDATTFHLQWPHAHVSSVVRAWQRWAPAAPDDLAASLLVTANAASPPVANVFGALIGVAPRASALLDELITAVGLEPATRAQQLRPYRQAKRYLAELGQSMAGGHDAPSEPAGHPLSKSEFFRGPLPDEAISALIEHLAHGPASEQARELDFTPWGGAYTRIPEDATAFPHRDARFLLKHGIVTDADASDGARRAARALADPVVGDGPSLGNRRRVPELPRPGARRRSARVPRRQLPAPRPRQTGLRPRQLLAFPAVDPPCRSRGGDAFWRGLDALHMTSA